MQRLLLIALLSIFSLGLSAQGPIENYDYTFKITGLPDTADSIVYMANYYGGKQYYFDTGMVEKGGVVHFKGESIDGGIYSLITQDRKAYFEFVVSEPKIEMESKVENFVMNMKVKTSAENQKFYEYLRYINDKSSRAQELKEQIEKTEGSEQEKFKDELRAIDKEVIAYKKTFISDNKDLFISKVFAASEEPEIPDFSEIEDETERQRKRYLAFKKGYLAGLDFTDDRLLRTPVFHNKLNYYISKLTPQVPDSVIKAADYLVSLCGDNKETHKYVVHTITSKYEDSKVMGMDAILVHMGLTYYCPDKAWWLSEEKLEKFCDRVEAMQPLMIGERAVNLVLQDTSGEWKSLYDIDAEYTVLYFWDSGCGHCKKVTPKLKDFYAEWKEKGVEVYAVGTEFETKEWIRYIEKHELPWINVSDTPEANENAHELIREGKTTIESMNFRDTYDIFSTPKVFLLDKNKEIVASKLMPEQLGEFIENYSKQKAAN